MVEKRNEGLLVEASPSERAEDVLRRMVEVKEVNGMFFLEAAPPGLRRSRPCWRREA